MRSWCYWCTCEYNIVDVNFFGEKCHRWKWFLVLVWWACYVYIYIYSYSIIRSNHGCKTSKTFVQKVNSMFIHSNLKSCSFSLTSSWGDFQLEYKTRFRKSCSQLYNEHKSWMKLEICFAAFFPPSSFFDDKPTSSDLWPVASENLWCRSRRFYNSIRIFAFGFHARSE